MQIFLIVLTILLLITSFVLKKIYNIQKIKTLLNIANVLLVVLLLELTIFNVNSYRLFFKDYKKLTYEIKNTDYTEYINDNRVIKDGTISKEITNIHELIGTIKLNINSDKPITYSVKYTDETSSFYRELPSKVLLGSLEKSKSIPIFLTGKTEKLKIELTVTEGTKISLESIEINEPIKFEFNIARFVILSVFILFIYAIKNLKVFNVPYGENKVIHWGILFVVIGLFVSILWWCCLTSAFQDEEYGKEYTHYYLDAIMKGKVSLLVEPDTRLQEMDNPYDRVARNANRIWTLWDVAYYNGNYYVYFGVFPVLTLLLPYKLITDQYMTANVATAIYSTVASIFLMGIIVLTFKRWFKDVPFKILVVSTIGLLMGSLLIWLCRRPSMYEIVIAGGVCLSVCGVFFMLKAIEKEHINYKFICVSCILLALAVSCRPTMLLASFIILPVIIKIFIENVKKKENVLKLVLTVGIPYSIVGIALMVYNYIRFDSIFEFGASYQLTENDMGNLAYRFVTIPVGLLNYFFALPQTGAQFPFIYATWPIMKFYGYYFYSTMAGGLLILNPILLVLLFIPKLKKYISKDLFKWILVLTVIGGFLPIIETVAGGSAQRYAADFAWMLILVAILVFVSIYKMIKDKTIKKYVFTIFGFVILYSGVINFLISGLQGEQDLLKSNYPDHYYGIGYTISFWE